MDNFKRYLDPQPDNTWHPVGDLGAQVPFATWVETAPNDAWRVGVKADWFASGSVPMAYFTTPDRWEALALILAASNSNLVSTHTIHSLMAARPHPLFGFVQESRMLVYNPWFDRRAMSERPQRAEAGSMELRRPILEYGADYTRWLADLAQHINDG